MASISGLASQTLDQADLLKLLVTQLQNQDPMEPVKDADFIGQLAQFSSLESMESLKASFDQQLQLQQLTSGASLIGRTVEYGSGGSGVVAGLQVQDGNIFLKVADGYLPLGYITGVKPT